MAPVEFYRRIGREDLAQEYTAREIRRNELMTAGAVIGLGSLVASAIIVTNALIQRELRREQSAGIRPVPCRKELTRGLGAPDSQRCRTRRRIARWRAAARRRIDQPKSNRRVADARTGGRLQPPAEAAAGNVRAAARESGHTAGLVLDMNF